MSASTHRRSTTLLLLSVCAVCVVANGACAMSIQEMVDGGLIPGDTTAAMKIRAAEKAKAQFNENVRAVFAAEEELRLKRKQAASKERGKEELRAEEERRIKILNSTSRVEQGVIHRGKSKFWTPEVSLTASNEGVVSRFTHPCTFDKPFVNVPLVKLFLAAIDHGYEYEVELEARVISTSTTNFVVEVITNVKSHYNFVWMAVDPIAYNTTVLQTLAVEGPTHHAEQAIPFAHGAPTACACGVSGLSLSANRNTHCGFRFDEKASQFVVQAGYWEKTGHLNYQEFILFGTAHPSFESGQDVRCKANQCTEVIPFKSKCDGRRTVSVLLALVDLEIDLRQMANATLITQDSFTLVQECWGRHGCHQMGASWIAHCEMNY